MTSKYPKSKFNYSLYKPVIMPEKTNHHKIKPKDIFMGLDNKKISSKTTSKKTTKKSRSY